MVGAALSSILLGASGLVVTSTTPDALCPSIEAAQQAVDARLGEMDGGPFEAKMTVVRQPASSEMTLKLTLSDPAGVILLERLLPLSESDCSVADQTVAYILERHFDGLDDAPSSDTTPSDPREGEDQEKEPATQETPPASVETKFEKSEGQSAEQAPPVEPPDPQSVSFGFGFGVTGRGLPQLHSEVSYFSGQHWGVNLTANVPFVEHREETDAYSVESFRDGYHLGGLVGVRKREWSLYGGAVLSLFREQALLSGPLVNTSGRMTRYSGGPGVQGLLSLKGAGRLWVDVSSRVGVALWGPDFVVQDVQREVAEPLSLPALTGEVSLSLRLELWSAGE